MEGKNSQKKKACVNWGKYGDCNLKDKCFFEHQDCPDYTALQKCNKKTCGLYHRKMCNNWKKDGKCTKAGCTYLHKTCGKKNCDEKACPFYHANCNRNIEEILEGFKKKCLFCETVGICVYLSCGENIYCERCAKEFIKVGKCMHCNSTINDYII